MHGPHLAAPARSCRRRSRAARSWRSAGRSRCAPPPRGRPRTSADRVWAGRPFFIRIGVSQASEAPAASRAASTSGHSRGSRSSTLVSSTSGASVPSGARRPGAARRPAAAARWRGWPGPGRRRRRRPPRRSSPAAARTTWRCAVSRAAPVGVHSSTSAARSGVRRDAAQQLGDRRRRHRHHAVRAADPVRSRRPPARPPARSRPRCTSPAQTPTTSAIASRAPTSWKCTSSGSVPCTAASATASRSNVAQRPGRGRRRERARPSSSARTSRQVRWVVLSATSTWQPGGREAVPGTRSPASARRARARRRRPPRTAPRSGTPGVDQRAEQHVPAGPRGRVDPADHVAGPRRGVAGHPGGEDAGAEAVVDVDDGDARARRS